jgi:hypothetical protein
VVSYESFRSTAPPPPNSIFGRSDDIGGDLTPEWGMHLVDANVAMGNIEDLVATQAEAYASSG